MDTKSTKFNLRTITKIVAVILALTVVCFSAKSTMDGVFPIIQQTDFDDDYYFEGLFFNEDADFYNGTIFERNMRTYLDDLHYYISIYGDGTKKSYEKLNNANSKKFETYKSNLINNLYYHLVEDESYTYNAAVLLTEGILKVELIEKSKTEDYHSFDATDELIYEYLYDFCCDKSKLSSETDFNKTKAEAKKLGADLIVTLPNIEIYEYERDVLSFAAGTYKLTVDYAKLKQLLMDNRLLGFFGTYEEYKAHHKQSTFKENYQNINYVITEADGSVITNVPDYTELENPISDYAFYLSGSEGKYYSNYQSLYRAEVYDYDMGIYSHIIRIEHPDQYVSEPVIHTTNHPAKDEVPVPTTYEEATTMKVTAPAHFGGTSAEKERPLIETSDLVVYFDEDATFFGESVYDMQYNLLVAGTQAKIIVRNATIGLGFYLAMLVLLMILSGRRKSDDEEIHLLSTDKIFVEIKFLINAALFFFAALAIIYIIDEYSYMSYSFARFMRGCLPVLVTVLFALVMDFILYLTRIIKAKRFLKSLIIGWVFKSPKYIFRFIKKVISFIFLPGKKLLGLYRDFRENFIHNNNIKKIVKTKTALWVIINIFAAMLFLICATGFIDHRTNLAFFSAMTVAAGIILLDGYILLRGLNFVGGVDRLLEVISAYRKGALDTYINRAAIPDYLIPAAEDLESLGDGIRIAVDEAVKQETTKTELITNISHDLKTPLTSIINYVELLKHCDIENETALSYLEVLGEKSDRLKHLISDLVEASKAATGNMEVNLINVSLKEIIAQIVGEHSDALDEKQLTVIYDIPEEDVLVRADSKLLYRVLENLIVNVKKYAMPSTRVYISAGGTDIKGIITIKNISAAPLNISPEELKQRFVRGDASRTTEGNGLGLSIAENLCLLQGGKLELDIVGDLFIAKIELNKV